MMYVCYRCNVGPCNIKVNDGKDGTATFPRILDNPSMNVCPVEGMTPEKVEQMDIDSNMNDGG